MSVIRNHLGLTLYDNGSQYTLVFAAVVESTLQPGTWNAMGLVPRSYRLGTYDTRKEADERAAAFAEEVLSVLERSTRLALLERKGALT